MSLRRRSASGQAAAAAAAAVVGSPAEARSPSQAMAESSASDDYRPRDEAQASGSDLPIPKKRRKSRADDDGESEWLGVPKAKVRTARRPSHGKSNQKPKAGPASRTNKEPASVSSSVREDTASASPSTVPSSSPEVQTRDSLTPTRPFAQEQLSPSPELGAGSAFVGAVKVEEVAESSDDLTPLASSTSPEPDRHELSSEPKQPQLVARRARATRLLRRINWKADAVYASHSAPLLNRQDGIRYAVQAQACFAPQMARFAQCHMCVTRQSGNVCLFRGARSFPVAPNADLNKPIVPKGEPFFLDSLEEDEAPDFPTEFNQPFTIDHAAQIKTIAAPALIPTLERELWHASHPDVRRIKLNLAERSECDTCLHAMFGGKFQCHLCGREQCFDCHQRLVDAEAEHTADALFERASQLDVEPELRRLLVCSGRRGERPLHTSASFIRLTRFRKADLERWIDDMKAWAATHQVPPAPTVPDAVSARYYARGHPVHGNQAFLDVPLIDFEPAPVPAPSTCALSHGFGPRPACDKLQPPSSQSIAGASHLFHSLWSKGETMVVDVDSADANYKRWTPDKFAEKVMDVRCIVGCNRTGQQRESTVGKFFARFGRNNTDEGHSMKIMDWPSTSDFQLVFPELFSDYMNSIPFGSVTRRDGVLNVAAHHPTNANPPDLGPKGYFSEISDDGPGGNGSTKLHMDVADAVNLMFWAGLTANGESGFAAWDLFRAEDADKIREFLYNLIAQKGKISLEQAKATHDDPIHAQNFFLDRDLRQQLADEYNVRPWRIYQRPGEVVFIPAGCAHQVCNFADCIKIASDFVSLENVQRCRKLTDEFRQQTKDVKLWRTDVLQLKSQLLWAWRSCERFDSASPASAPMALLTVANLGASSSVGSVSAVSHAPQATTTAVTTAEEESELSTASSSDTSSTESSPRKLHSRLPSPEHPSTPPLFATDMSAIAARPASIPAANKMNTVEGGKEGVDEDGEEVGERGGEPMVLDEA